MANKPTFSQNRKSFSIDKLKAKANQSINGKDKGASDTRFWSLTKDKAGNGEATIRFLPGVIETDNDLPYVEYFEHYFRGPGGWFKEICPNTIGEYCPVCKSVSDVYQSHTKEEAKKIVAGRGKQQYLVANIYVVKDAASPENEGKVFLYKFKKTVLEKLMERIDNTDEDLDTVIPFSIDETGADFVLKTYQADANDKSTVKYDKSYYRKPNKLKVTDVELEAILNSQQSLNEFVDPSIVKSKEYLEEKLANVLKSSTVAKTAEDRSLDSSSEKSVDEESVPSAEPETMEETVDVDVDEEIRKLLG